jgi:hypothetical protein
MLKFFFNIRTVQSSESTLWKIAGWPTRAEAKIKELKEQFTKICLSPEILSKLPQLKAASTLTS